MWALGEAEGRPTGRNLAVKIKEDDSSLQWDLPKDAMNLDLQWGCKVFLHFEYPSADDTEDFPGDLE